MAGQFHKNLKQMLYFLCNPVNWKPNWISHAVQSLTQGVKQESGSASKHRLRDRRWGEGLVKQKLRPLGETTNIHRDKWSARLPSSGRTEQEQQFQENFTLFLFADKTPQVTAKAREHVQYTFLCTCPDWSQGGTAGHLETRSMTLFEKTVLRRVVWDVIVQSSSVSMSHINSVTRPHCVSPSEKDLFTNYSWKVDVDYALCKKTLWVMYNS